MRCTPASFYIIPIYIILAQANKINILLELFRNNLHFLEAKGLGLSRQEKNECFGRQSKHSFESPAHSTAALNAYLYDSMALLFRPQKIHDFADDAGIRAIAVEGNKYQATKR